jgi:hypothetical protein
MASSALLCIIATEVDGHPSTSVFFEKLRTGKLVFAGLKVKEMLNNYEPPELPADVDKDLRKFIAKLG